MNFESFLCPLPLYKLLSLKMRTVLSLEMSQNIKFKEGVRFSDLAEYEAYKFL